MPDGELRTGVAKGARQVPAAVVGQHTLDDHLAVGPPGDRPTQKRRARGALLIGQDLDVGHATVIIDGDMHVLPADAAGPLAAIAMNSMPDAANAPERFDIEVEHVA